MGKKYAENTVQPVRQRYSSMPTSDKAQRIMERRSFPKRKSKGHGDQQTGEPLIGNAHGSCSFRLGGLELLTSLISESQQANGFPFFLFLM